MRVPHRRVFAATVLAAVLGLASHAPAQSPGNLGTVVITMKGTLVRDKRAADAVGWGGISFGFTGDDVRTLRWFGVVHASLFGGNTFDAKAAVFRTHYVPALTAIGPPELARKLATLPEGTRVQVEGVVDRRSRTILLDVVQPLE